MKKVLYITNIEVPYKITFFNEMNKYCDLFVLYEHNIAKYRNAEWSKSIKNNCKHDFLDKQRNFFEKIKRIKNLINNRI